jgi:hemolysin III
MEQDGMGTSSEVLMLRDQQTNSVSCYTYTEPPPPHQTQATYIAQGDEDIESDCWWHFTDFGQVGDRSRDGSVHATDEVFNSVSHLSAFFMSILASVLLIAEASAQGAPWKIVSFSIYGASLCFLFAASTLHHSISTTAAWEGYFQLLDYLAIFPLIAGTFTPLCLVFFPYSTIGWCFFSVVWVLSIASMFLVAKFFEKVPKWLTMTMYITLGWLGAFMAFWLWPFLGNGGLTLLIVGGFFYTVGGYIYSTEYPNPWPGRFGFHEMWHIFVVLGAAVHWFMMYKYVLYWQRPE